MFVEFHAAMKAIALLKSHNLHNTKHNIILKNFTASLHFSLNPFDHQYKLVKVYKLSLSY